MPQGSIISRVAPEHRQKLATPLDAAHADALRSMFTAGLLRPVVPSETADALIAAGYAHETFGGLALTDVGQVRAMMELGQ